MRAASGVLLSALTMLAACAGKVQTPAGPPDGEVWLSKEAMEKGKAHLAAAAEHDLPQAVLAPGRIAFDDLRVAHVFPPVSGRVTRVLAAPGQVLKKGAPLLALASPELGSAAADDLKARADLRAAEHELERQRKLVEAQAGPQRDLDAALSAYEKARAELARTAQRLTLLRAGSIDAVTQEYVLRSPIAGTVISRSVNPGVEVQGQYAGGTAQELFTVGEVSRVWAVAEVQEQDLPAVRLGAEVSVAVIAYPGKRFRGRVEWIATALDPALRTAKVRCSLDNRGGELRPEMYAMLSIARPPRRMLALPAKAVVSIGDQSFAYVVTGKSSADGRSIFRRQRLQLAEEPSLQRRGPGQPLLEMRMPAEQIEDLAPVAAGLKPGEQVLVEGPGSRDFLGEEAAVSEAQIQAAGIAVEVAEKRAVPESVLVGGRLTFDDQRVTHIFSPVTGRVTQVLAAPGQRVERGAPLAIVSSPDLASAVADVAKARADLVAAERERKRQRELHEAGAGALRDLQIAEDALARAQAEAARAQLKSRLFARGEGGAPGEYVVRSPLAGEVVARLVNPGAEVQGQYAGNSPAVELFTVGSLDRLWVLADVYELDLPRVQRGQRVTIEAQGKTLAGEVDWIASALDPVQRTAKVRCAIDNSLGLLRPEAYQPVRIAIDGPPVLAVPRESVLRLGGETVLFVAKEKKDAEGRLLFARRRVLSREGEPSGLVPVFAGLEPGEKVVTRGAIFLAGAL
jgi:cobalt-zinc-cadmium efflux system membrane fusion protein